MAVDNSAKIAALEQIRASGARTVNVDGLATTFRSLDELNQEIERLKNEDTVNGYTKRRKVQRIDLSRF